MNVYDRQLHAMICALDLYSRVNLQYRKLSFGKYQCISGRVLVYFHANAVDSSGTVE